MTPQERALITLLLDRLNKTEGHSKDPEAETLIREAAVGWPDVPYSLVQTVLIQDLSLHSAQSRISDLEMQLTEVKRASSAPPSFLGSPSFLGAVFGRDDHSGGVRMRNVPPADPGTGLPVPATPQPGSLERGSAVRSASGAPLMGGGFLRSAAVTAAGIAGGALLLEGIPSMFGQQDAASITVNRARMPGLGETVLNNHYGADTGASDGESTDEHAGPGDAVEQARLAGVRVPGDRDGRHGVAAAVGALRLTGGLHAGDDRSPHLGRAAATAPGRGMRHETNRRSCFAHPGGDAGSHRSERPCRH